MTTAAPPPETGDTAPSQATPGQILRAAREARGMHLAVLSMALKVPIRQLEALERDEYAALKGVTFIRALAHSVCRHLGIDPAPVLAGLPQGVSQLQAVGSVSAQSLTAPRWAARSLGRSHGLSRRVLLLALVMLLGSAALIWWPDPAPSAQPVVTEITEATPLALPTAPASSPTPALAPMSVASESLTPLSSGASAPSLPTASPPKPSAPVAVQAAAAVVQTPPAPVQPPDGAASADRSQAPLEIRVRADVWLELRDKQTRIVVSRQLKAGEVLTQDLAAPFFVYVSKADSTEMRWNGKAVDLLAHAQNNEARLQVRP